MKFQLPGPIVAMFNDNSSTNPSHFAQLSQCLTPRVPQDLAKNNIANNVVSNKQAIKLPQLSLPHLFGKPLRYHVWINNFFSMFHNKNCITETQRITYFQKISLWKSKTNL